MSKAVPLTTDIRESHYLAQTGRTDLTPAQARRVRHKQNEAARTHPRTGRMRRRYDRTDQAQVRSRGAQFAAFVRQQITGSRFAPKPGSKRQQQLRRMSR
jgi:hypothetical protein